MRYLNWMLSTALALSAAGVYAEGKHHEWDYGVAHGPQHWGALKPDFATCDAGKSQSPIDIRGAVPSQLEPIRFEYKPAPLRIIDNGHTIQVNYAPGSFITVGGKRYELVQFHFHKPSEERLNGRSFDMVAHLVHKDAEGKLAVVAVLLAKGEANPLIQTLWDNLPKTEGTESAVDAVKVNAADLLPRNRGYYTFAGSLTTPPCTEGVTWMVLKHSTAISADEVARFAQIYPMNARPVQPLNGREIRVSD